MEEKKEILSLNEAKEYLRVGYEEDDEQIKFLITAAEVYIDNCVGTAYKVKENYKTEEEYTKGRNLAALLQKKIISDMYDERGTTVSSSTKKSNIVVTILDVLANVGA